MKNCLFVTKALAVIKIAAWHNLCETLVYKLNADKDVTSTAAAGG